MDTLFARRPSVHTVHIRMRGMSAYVPFLTPASMLHFGQISHAVWVYLDLLRQADVNQPVGDQLRLAGIEAAARNMSRICQRYYLDAMGVRNIESTQDAHAALDQVNAYDVRFAPTFDVENAVLRILNGTRVL